MVPVLVLTSMVAWLRLQGEALGGPLTGSVFARMGGSLSLLLPLALISATWAGHGIRDRLPSNLFAGGLLGTATVIGGRVLQTHRVGQGMLPEHGVQALLLGAGFAWLWAIGWLAMARRRDDRVITGLLHSPLLRVQGRVGSALLALVLAPAFLMLAIAPIGEVPSWAAASGSLTAWLVLALATAGHFALAWGRGQTLTLGEGGMLSLGAAVLLGCTAERLGLSGLPVLMLALAALSAGWAWGQSLGPSRDSALPWAITAGLLAMALALGTFMRGELHLTSATTVALAAIASASLAWRRQAEGWMLPCALLLALGATFVVWWRYLDEPFTDWALELVQTDFAVVGAVSLLWLRARHRLYVPALSADKSVCLDVQTRLGLVAPAFLSLSALGLLITSPQQPASFVGDVGTPMGWLALVLNLTAAWWYAALAAPGRVIHVIGAGGLLAGILAAAPARAIDWLAYDALMTLWTVVGLGMLMVAWASHQPGVGPHIWPAERRAAAAQLLQSWLPASGTRLGCSLRDGCRRTRAVCHLVRTGTARLGEQ